jgi:hypothetical protein
MVRDAVAKQTAEFGARVGQPNRIVRHGGIGILARFPIPPRMSEWHEIADTHYFWGLSQIPCPTKGNYSGIWGLNFPSHDKKGTRFARETGPSVASYSAIETKRSQPCLLAVLVFLTLLL